MNKSEAKTANRLAVDQKILSLNRLWSVMSPSPWAVSSVQMGVRTPRPGPMRRAGLSARTGEQDGRRPPGGGQ